MMVRTKLATIALAIVTVVLAVGLLAPPASAQYVWREDDYVTAKTTHAIFDGSWNNATAGLVRWYYDASNGVKRGEFKATSVARARSGLNPLCIAAVADSNRIAVV